MCAAGPTRVGASPARVPRFFPAVTRLHAATLARHPKSLVLNRSAPRVSRFAASHSVCFSRHGEALSVLFETQMRRTLTVISLFVAVSLFAPAAASPQAELAKLAAPWKRAGAWFTGQKRKLHEIW